MLYASCTVDIRRWVRSGKWCRRSFVRVIIVHKYTSLLLCLLLSSPSFLPVFLMWIVCRCRWQIVLLVTWIPKLRCLILCRGFFDFFPYSAYTSFEFGVVVTIVDIPLSRGRGVLVSSCYGTTWIWSKGCGRRRITILFKKRTVESSDNVKL